jgi:hypothetical protein
MKRVIAAFALLLLAVPVLAADIARDPAVVIEGVQTTYTDVMLRGDACVVGLIDGTFTDVTPYYAAGLTAAGYIPDVIYDPAGGTSYAGYSIVFATSSDLWWGPSAFTWGAVQADFGAYMDAGGRLMAVGQDWIYSSGGSAFHASYLGLASVVEDVNYNDTGSMSWNGTAAGPLAGLTGSMLPCFTANPWFTDQITAATQGLVQWSSPLAPAYKEGGCLAVKGGFSVVEFGCGTVDVVGPIAAWFDDIATGESSISAVKALY